MRSRVEIVEVGGRRRDDERKRKSWMGEVVVGKWKKLRRNDVVVVEKVEIDDGDCRLLRRFSKHEVT